MKIRNGFVSNSSSSSFIIKEDERFKTVYDAAKYIITDMTGDYSEELKTLQLIKDNPDIPVHFDSGEGTYIRKFKNFIIVSTTQHYNPINIESHTVDFNDIEVGTFDELKYDNEDGEHIEIEHYEDFDYYWEQFDDFLLLQYNIYGRPIYSYNICPDCGGWRCVKLMGEESKVCICKIKKHVRKKKLNEINQK